jgi:hypothetical protein
MKGMRRWLSPTLGAWHSYKMANILNYRTFAHTFMGHLHFAMNPTQPWFPNQYKLPKLVLRFTWIRLAYPNFRKQLHDAIRFMEQRREHKKAGYIHLRNLKMLCEWYIPLVTIIITLSYTGITPPSEARTILHDDRPYAYIYIFFLFEIAFF